MYNNKNLEYLYRLGCEALTSGDINKQRQALALIEANAFSSTKNAALTYIKTRYTNVEIVPMNQLRPESVIYNLHAYCQALWDEMHIGQPSVGFLAVERLQQNINHFELDTALYNSNNGILTVSDLLKIIKFALSCLQFMTGIDTSKERQAITALRRLELLLSNQQSDLDGIGYVAEILSAISEQMTMNPAIKQNIVGLETIFLMACDFFSR